MVTRYGVLERKIAEHPGMEVWAVYMDGAMAEAVLYPELVGSVNAGDRVLLNTTAVELELGTGGQHFVVARADIGATPAQIAREDGHIIKLRYTPLQCRVLAAEEEASPYHDALRLADRLPGTPVLCLGLHSQLAPALGGIKASRPDVRVGFVMTDSAALPLVYSRLVNHLTQAGLLDVTISAGQAFGGNLEAVNIYSGMVTAVVAGKADIIIAGQGPGNVGTDTPLGFGGIEQAMLLNAAAGLEGVPIAVPRISFADPRERHLGISHHTVTVLGRLTLAPVVLPMPLTTPESTDRLQAQIAQHGLTRHTLHSVDALPGITLCQQRGIPLASMGRRYDDDPLFFQAASAAGRVAAEMLGKDNHVQTAR